MSRSDLVIVALGFGLLALGAVAVGGATAQDETVTVEVNLVDQEDDGIGGAELTAVWDDGSDAATTTSSGLAFLEVPEGADVEIRMDHPEYVRNKPYQIENAAVPAGEDRLQTTIRASLSGTAAITVEDSDGPVGDVTVRLREQFGDRDRLDRFRTSANGLVETPEIERGTYTVTTSASRYLDTQTTLTVDEDDVSESITIEQGFVDLTVNVTDDYFDSPQALANARIDIEGDTVSTRSDGTRTTDVAVNTRLDVTVTRDGYQSVTETVNIRESAQTLNVSIQREPELNLQSSQQRIVIGESTTVTATNAYADPAEDVTISLDGSEVGQTDSMGQLSIEIQTPGSQDITAERDGLSTSVTVEGIDPDADDDTGEIDTEEPEDDDSLGPGFGVAAALVALLAVAVAARRR